MTQMPLVFTRQFCEALKASTHVSESQLSSRVFAFIVEKANP